MTSIKSDTTRGLSYDREGSEVLHKSSRAERIQLGSLVSMGPTRQPQSEQASIESRVVIKYENHADGGWAAQSVITIPEPSIKQVLQSLGLELAAKGTSHMDLSWESAKQPS